jgi:hypothetical protein
VRFLLIVVIAALVARLERGRWERLRTTIDSALAWRWTPALVGLAWAAIICWIWGGVRSPAIFHDELSYRFQAQLFATGRWFAPSPPMADMFAQPHLLVAPVMASKYPPGHALLLAIGEWLRMPGLIVLALVALRAAVTFALARRLTNGGIALLTCVLLLEGDSLRWSASYFSETTTGAMLVVCWYALLRWRESANEDGGWRREEGGGRMEEGGTDNDSSLLAPRSSFLAPRSSLLAPPSSLLAPRSSSILWISVLAAALGWSAITRPYSAILFAIPLGFVVLRDVWRARRWRDLAVAMAIGTAIVAILPLWSARTTGDWKLWPATLYTRDYMPYDHPHFGVDSATPRRELPLDLAALDPSLRTVEREHTIARLPAVALSRLPYFLLATWDAPLFALMLTVIGITAAPMAVWLGVATVGAVFVGYLAHPTWADWTIYYMEVAPALVFLTACGMAQLYAILARAPGEPVVWRRASRPTIAIVVASILLLVGVKKEGGILREMRTANEIYIGRFQTLLGRVPAPSVLFVRYSPRHSGHLSLITNGPDWERAPVWVVPDRGHARNAALLAVAHGRTGLLFDELRGQADLYDPQHLTDTAR